VWVKVCVDVCVCASESDTAKGRVIVSESVQVSEERVSMCVFLCGCEIHLYVFYSQD